MRIDPDTRYRLFQDLELESGDFSRCLHTALRKCCDSTPTSLAYNLIAMDSCDGAWRLWLEEAWRLFGIALAKGPLLQAEMIAVCKEATEAALDWGAAARNALRIAFGYFEDSDWLGFLEFVVEEVSDETADVSGDGGGERDTVAAVKEG